MSKYTEREMEIVSFTSNPVEALDALMREGWKPPERQFRVERGDYNSYEVWTGNYRILKISDNAFVHPKGLADELARQFNNGEDYNVS